MFCNNECKAEVVTTQRIVKKDGEPQSVEYICTVCGAVIPLMKYEKMSYPKNLEDAGNKESVGHVPPP